MSVSEYTIIKDKKTELLKLKKLHTYTTAQENFDTINDIVELINDFFYYDLLDSEHHIVVALDNQNKVKGFFESGIGNDKQVECDKRSIAIFLLLVGAKRFLTFHNHPDGITESSQNDETYVIEMHTLGNTIGVEFSGGYIICDDEFTKIRNMLEEIGHKTGELK